MKTPHILIVEDEKNLAELISDYLLHEHYQVTVMNTGKGVTELIEQNHFDLILLDLMLPEIDGLTICKQVRHFSQTPVIITTAKIDEIDRIIGLEIGADDYVCKPYSPRELIARIKVQLRRLENNKIKDHFSLNADSLHVKIGENSVELTVVEYNILQRLVSNPGRIYSRDQLMDAAYPDNRIVNDRTIDSHIKKIRQKILSLKPKHQYIHSIYGRGYKYDPRA